MRQKIATFVFFSSRERQNLYWYLRTYPFVEIQYLSSHTGIPQRVVKYLLRRRLLARNSTNCKIHIGKHVCKM